MYDGGVSETTAVPLAGQSPLAWSPNGNNLLVVRKDVEIWKLGQRVSFVVDLGLAPRMSCRW